MDRSDVAVSLIKYDYSIPDDITTGAVTKPKRYYHDNHLTGALLHGALHTRFLKYDKRTVRNDETGAGFDEYLRNTMVECKNMSLSSEPYVRYTRWWNLHLFLRIFREDREKDIYPRKVIVAVTNNIDINKTLWDDPRTIRRYLEDNGIVVIAIYCDQHSLNPKVLDIVARRIATLNGYFSQTFVTDVRSRRAFVAHNSGVQAVQTESRDMVYDDIRIVGTSGEPKLRNRLVVNLEMNLW